MKAKGNALIYKTVETMKPGETGYTTMDGVIVTTRNELFLDLDSIVLPEMKDEFTIAIKRLSQERDDYEIDLNWPSIFAPTSEEIDLSLPDNKSLIGPISIESTIVSDELYRKRLSVEELLAIQEALEDEEDYEKVGIIKKIINIKRSSN